MLGIVASRNGRSMNGHVRNGRSRIGHSRIGTSTLRFYKSTEQKQKLLTFVMTSAQKNISLNIFNSLVTDDFVLTIT